MATGGSINSIKSFNNSNTYQSRDLNITIEPEEMDLEEKIQQVYNEEMKKKEFEREYYSSLINDAKSAGANVSSGAVTSANYNKRDLADLTKSALDQLESNSGIVVIRNDVSNKKEALDIKIEKDYSNYDYDKSKERISIEAVSPADEGMSGTVTGNISPGTFEKTFPGKKYQLDDETKRELMATVYAEADEGFGYIESDSMGVASVILNRVEDKTGEFRDSVHDVIFQDNAFDGTKKTKFENAMKDPSVIKQKMVDSVNRVLKGERNTDGLFFNGNGEYNSFRKEY